MTTWMRTTTMTATLPTALDDAPLGRSKTKSLFLVRGESAGDKLLARALGTKLMQQGHTVFLSETDEDIEIFGDVVDGYVVVGPDNGVSRAVLYQLPERVQPTKETLCERAVLSLPANDDELSTFADQLESGSAQ